jgi:hypothetical protein
MIVMSFALRAKAPMAMNKATPPVITDFEKVIKEKTRKSRPTNTFMFFDSFTTKSDSALNWSSGTSWKNTAIAKGCNRAWKFAVPVQFNSENSYVQTLRVSSYFTAMFLLWSCIVAKLFVYRTIKLTLTLKD